MHKDDDRFVVGLVVVMLLTLSIGVYFIRHFSVSEGRLKVSLCLANDHTNTEYDCRKRHGYWGDMK